MKSKTRELCYWLAAILLFLVMSEMDYQDAVMMQKHHAEIQQ